VSRGFNVKLGHYETLAPTNRVEHMRKNAGTFAEQDSLSTCVKMLVHSLSRIR
jgi:hypothetical protein